MKAENTHIFEIPELGKVELELTNPSHDFYAYEKNHNPLSFSLKYHGVKQQYKSFHLFEWQKIVFSSYFNGNTDQKESYKLLINENTKAESKLWNGNHIISTYYSFRNQVGETKIQIINQRSKVVFELIVEVFPQKMDYKSDYRAMMLDISEIVRNLAYSFLKDTYQKAKPKIQGHTTEHEWWNILDELFDLFVKNIEVIKRQPKHEIIYSEKVLPIERVKKGSAKNISWFQKNSKYINESQGLNIGQGKYSTHALSVKKQITYDTYENRFVVYGIKETILRLIQYKKQIQKNDTQNSYGFLINRINHYLEKLQALLMQTPFNEVSKFEKRSFFSTTLTRGAGYRDYLQIFMLLNKGLEILNDDIFKIEQKEISTLYEYWCFLKLYKLIQQNTSYGMNYQDLIQFKAGKFNVDLKKGEQSKIKFKNQLGEGISLYFNRSFSTKQTFTFDQKPDLTLKLNKQGYKAPFWYILDAKYRFDKETQHGDFNAPDDAIGQLHRYRDSILHSFSKETSYKAAIKNMGGIILYPYPKEEIEFTNNKYFKSIEDVNIGALPFLPSKTKLVESFIKNLINDKSPEDHFEEIIHIDAREYEEKKKTFEDWITIGLLKKQDQDKRMDFLQKKKIHYIPHVKNQHTRIYSSSAILVCVSGSNFGFLYKIKSNKILTREELMQEGITWKLSRSKYIVFDLDSKSEKIEISPKMIPINFRYTTKGALDLHQTNKFQDNNALYINSNNAYRLYTALNRKQISFDITWSESNFDEVIFIVGGKKIFVRNDFYSLNAKTNHHMNITEILKEISLSS